MLVANFMRFRRKRLKKQTHIDNFLYFLYIFLYLKKNSVNFRKKKSKKILKIIFSNFLFLKKKVGKKLVKSRLIHQSKDRKLSVNFGYFRLKHRLHNLPGCT